MNTSYTQKYIRTYTCIHMFINICTPFVAYIRMYVCKVVFAWTLYAMSNVHVLAGITVRPCVHTGRCSHWHGIWKKQVFPRHSQIVCNVWIVDWTFEFIKWSNVDQRTRRTYVIFGEDNAFYNCESNCLSESI